MVIAFTGWNENVHMSERAQLPTGPSGVACAERVRGVLDDDARRAVKRGQVDGQPGEVHGDERVARSDPRRVEVERVRIDVDEVGGGADVAGQFAVATNESGEVSTRSPGPMPAVASVPCSAAVPLENATACGRRVSADQLRLELVEPGGRRSASRLRRVAMTAATSEASIELPAVRDHASQFGVSGASRSLSP